MQTEIKNLLDRINPENYHQCFQELFYLIIRENLTLSEIQEIKEYINDEPISDVDTIQTDNEPYGFDVTNMR